MPQKNTLILENGILKLYPLKPSESTSNEENSQSSPYPIDNQDFYSDYSTQIYPHLMPQNFLRAQQKKMPRSNSDGSVLV